MSFETAQCRHFFCPSFTKILPASDTRWLQRSTGSVKAYTHPPASPGAIVPPFSAALLPRTFMCAAHASIQLMGLVQLGPQLYCCLSVTEVHLVQDKAQLPRCPSATACHAFTRVSSWLSQFDCVALQSHVCAYAASTRCVWCSPRRTKDQWSHHVSESQWRARGSVAKGWLANACQID
jgi:hypothetical protein